MMLAIALALLQSAVAPVAPAAAPPPTVTWSVVPESVTVAQPFTVTVRVRVPREMAVAFPVGPDSAQNVEAVDPPSIIVEDAGDALTERRASYRLMAWDTGRLTVPLAPVTIGTGAAMQSVPLAPAVVVVSVLPADSALRIPRPVRDILATEHSWWPILLGLLANLFVIGMLYRSWRSRRAPPPPPAPLAAAEEAMRRIDRLGLLEAGEPSRHVRLHVDALRDYLSAKVPSASRAQTSAELVAALRGRALPVERVAALLADADHVQFARRGVTAARAKEIAAEVRAVLSASEEAFARDIAPREKVA